MNDDFWFYMWYLDDDDRRSRRPVPPWLKFLLIFTIILALKLLYDIYF